MPPRKRAAKKTTTRKAPAKKASPRPAPKPIEVPSGHRLFVLSVPFEERMLANAHGARWDAHTRQSVYVGERLPAALATYAAPDYSWERFVENQANRSTAPTQPSAMKMTPRPHQVEAINKIAAANTYGYRGFLEADDVGLGKTLASWLGAVEVAKARGARTVLVMCPKGVIPHWRRTIAALGDHGLEVVVINYDRAKSLLSVPESAASASRTRTKNKRIAASGQPTVDWDIILYDESHKLKNRGAQRTQAATRIARYSAQAASAPFVIWMSATAGQDPTELGYLAPLFAQITGATKSDLRDFGQWLADEGFSVTFNARFDTWDWGTVPADASPAQIARINEAKATDLQRVHQMLFGTPHSPAIRRLPTDVAGWPEVQRILHPVDLGRNERRLYEEAWTSFRADMNLAARGRDPHRAGFAARLRFRQKASLIRVPGTIELIQDALDNGHQVAVSVEFHETLEAIRDGLASSKVSVGEFSGRNTTERESERIAFQRGHHQVMLFTVVEGISLHQKELLEDGSTATDVVRTLVIHDPRYSGLDSLQLEGRTCRDGQASNVYYTFAAGTVEEKIVRTLVGRARSTKAMVGDDVQAIVDLEALLDTAEDLWEEKVPGSTENPRQPDRVPATATPPRPAAPPAPARPTVRPAAPSTPARRVRQTAPTAPTPVRTRRNPREESMTPEERALRAALSGGKKAAGKRPETPAERAAYERRLRNG